MNNGFNIEEFQIPTNKDVTVNYKPHNTKEYSYKVFKDGKVIDQKTQSQKAFTIKLSETGTYYVQIERFEYNEQIIEKTKDIVIDKEAPVISLKEKRIIMSTNHKLNVMNNVKANDNFDGDITEYVVTNVEELDLNVLGEKILTYTATDKAGNETIENVTILVTKGVSENIVYAQLAIFIGIIAAIIIIFKFKKNIAIERRIARHSVKSIHEKSKSIIDKILEFFQRHFKHIAKIIRKSRVLTKSSKIYSRRVQMLNYEITTEEILAQKIMIGVLFIFLGIFSKIIKMDMLDPLEALYAYLVGSTIPEIYYIVKERMYRNKLENDLLQAITVMNNAFKSGKSITQAVSLVSDELEGPIANEFEKMQVELSFGLDITVVFTRFADRIQLEEARYLTSSLTILNNTGGNIIKVFDSIEESLFNKKKIKLELETLTASSKIILYVLFIVPVLFVLIITLIDPTYFEPFFTSIFGIIYFSIILISYFVYIFILRKIMKVRF